MSTDTIPIRLSLAERHVLTHLLRNFIDSRAWELIRAGSASQVQEGAERARLYAQIHSLAEEQDGSLPVADLDAQRAELALWASETDVCVGEHDEGIAEDSEDKSKNGQERRDAIERERERICIEYAHAGVCGRIVGQIDAARELVA